jgi:hypothetical protein
VRKAQTPTMEKDLLTSPKSLFILLVILPAFIKEG